MKLESKDIYFKAKHLQTRYPPLYNAGYINEATLKNLDKFMSQ